MSVANNTLGSFTPRGNRRLIYVSDPSNTTSHLSEPAAQPEEFRQIVRNYAQGSIDTVVQEIFAECMTMFWRTDKCSYDIRFQHQRNIPLMDSGTMPVELYIDECHKQGIEFIAGFRMNDRHGHFPAHFKKLCEEKPEWVLREYKPSTKKAPPESHEYGCSINYAIPEVRQWLFSIMEEVANRFDIDGIEFNFTRLAECFPLAQLDKSHHIMTDFVRQVRTMLDEVGKQKERDLILGVRVLQQLKGCLQVSLDVPTWISEGLINYVAPGDFGFTDFNEPYEDFTSIARQHDCYVYPQLQPRLSITNTEAIMETEQYRAALRNFYGAGADGFSTQNFFFHWGPKFDIPGDSGAEIPAEYPKAMNIFRELKDPDAVANSDKRHYTFIPLWNAKRGLGQWYEAERIELSAAQIGQPKSLRVRICEHLPSQPADASGKFTFYARGLSQNDILEITINDVEISIEQQTWTWPNNDESLPSCTIALISPPFVYGDNILTLKLTESTEEAHEIIVDQIDCWI